jgi:hypothetical protein
MTKEEIAAVLAEHKAWLENKGGKRASLVGASLDGASLVGARLDRARLDYARLDGARLDRAYLDGASLVGASLVGAYLDGAKINDKTIIRIMRRARRSDGFEFFLWHCQEGFFIKAGCRFLSMDEARDHWTSTRGGTPLGDETLDILTFFEAAIVRQEATK